MRTSMTNTDRTDPHLWLEEVEGERALDWVRRQNERTLAELQSDPRYAGFEAAALDVLTSEDRIPYGTIRDGLVYNFWQDEQHVRGVWRRTPMESYRTSAPEWDVILDVDALAEAEDANWVFKGANVFRPDGSDRYLCLLSLSDGGKDAIVQREFDIESRQFVTDGFTTPEAKQAGAWIDDDHVLIGTDWGVEDGGTAASTVTDSGYPFVVKQWTRGTALTGAEELLRGKPTDVGVFPFTIEKEDGNLLAGAVQADTFFTSTYWLFTDDGAVQWPIPPKATPNGISHGRFIFSLEQDWQPAERRFQTGDLVAFDIDAFLDTHELPPVELVFRPSASQSVSGIAVASGGTLLSISENVVGQVLRLEPTSSGWTTSRIELPGTGDVGITFSDHKEATVLLNYEDFLTPTSLLALNSTTDQIDVLKTLPDHFDTEGLVVNQLVATSPDGTGIPYFTIRRADVVFDGSTPTLLYGYGGFQVPLNPSYSGTIGRNWLEHGGAFVLANIRGGGEFGPAWHQAGLKTNRQRIYDDFIAVAESIIDSELTSPEHLGIMGGSNGGLLMGVMLNQRPDLWGAVVVQVPLLDMLRYHLLLAGASWVDEYGSPDDPDERAFLETISPYQNFDPDRPYPTPLFVTSTKDDRVHPGHARKLAKKFEDAGRPFWYYENIDGGHSAAANQTEAARRTALEFTYLMQQLAKPAA
jgi:prolyl oligopeptidase